MSSNTYFKKERDNINKLTKLQLPNQAKVIGWIILSIAFIALFFTTKETTPKLISKYSMLIGLLIISISKEKIEDELVKNLRMYSFTFAFILSVFVTITHPISSHIVNLATTKNQEVFGGMGDWMILWLLLSTQVFYFEFLKRIYSCEK